MLKVAGIFKSIQGEGAYTGFPTLFIRLGGCNLRCSYCDTEHALTQDNTINLTSKELLEEIVLSNVTHVCITGGEPLLQSDGVYELAQLVHLYHPEIKISIETNGSQEINGKSPVSFTMDVKCPSSGVIPNMDVLDYNYGQLYKPQDEIKFVIGSKDDFDFAVAELKKIRKINVNVPIIFSPVDVDGEQGQMAKDLAYYMLTCRDCKDVRLGLQIHKYIGVE